MEFEVNEKAEMVKFKIGDWNEEVTFKYALQLATKIIQVLTGGNQKRMERIMNGSE